jgi:hypothetical protein
MTMSLSGLVKFVLGFVLAIALLFLTGAGLTRYLLTRLATPPPRPSFPNDPSPSPMPKVSPAAASTSPAATPAASPVEASPSPSPVGYQARVTQPIGLIVRQEANPDSSKIGGVEYNQELTILEESTDGAWQKVRLANGTEGWVKSGNTERAN